MKFIIRVFCFPLIWFVASTFALAFVQDEPGMGAGRVLKRNPEPGPLSFLNCQMVLFKTILSAYPEPKRSTARKFKFQRPEPGILNFRPGTRAGTQNPEKPGTAPISGVNSVGDYIRLRSPSYEWRLWLRPYAKGFAVEIYFSLYQISYLSVSQPNYSSISVSFVFPIGSDSRTNWDVSWMI